VSDTTKGIKVVYGPNEFECSSGSAKNVAELRAQAEAILCIPPGAEVRLDGVAVPSEKEKTTKVAGAKEVVFVKESGSKS